MTQGAAMYANSQRRRGGALACALLLAGCGVDYRTAPVSGRIMLDDQPLSGASVTFQPIGQQDSGNPRGMGSYGRTDADGRYSLKLVENDAPGAAVGMHRVQVSLPAETAASDTAAGGGADRVPSPYRGLDSQLIIDVPREGTTEANFELRTNP
jgi:hypothetical protein